MTVPHDPAHRARLSYTWLDERWHLIDEPEPTVVLISDSVSKGEPHSSPELAEAAFWRAIATSILNHRERTASFAYDGAEAAVLVDYGTGLIHLACRDGEKAGARHFASDNNHDAIAAWTDAVRVMLNDRLPGWIVWVSNNGRGNWYATRTTDLTEAEEDRGVSRTIVADTPLGLLELVRAQETADQSAQGKA